MTTPEKQETPRVSAIVRQPGESAEALKTRLEEARARTAEDAKKQS